ncbi:uncharacterized protein At2g29880-like [Aristolochia californica]|uniref:uncharacterized protein At2g29880-like n=1 Tax=Aristolochia californica TaxID=171875 RepID=UPI0035DA7DA8
MDVRRQPTVRPYDIWTFEDDSKMLDLLVEQINIGNRLPNGVWKHGVYMDCVNKFNEDAVNKKTVEQLKNRTRSWKKTYQTVTSCINTSGFGWDATTKRVTACNSVWLDYIKEHRDAEKYKCEGCPLYDKLAVVVGNTIAMGSGSLTFIEQGDELIRESEHVPMGEPKDVDIVGNTPSPLFSGNESTTNQFQRSNRSYSNRRRKRSEISSDDTSRFIDIMDQMDQTLKDVMKPKKTNWVKALREIPDLSVDLKFRAPVWLDTPIKQEYFTEMTVEERLEWLKYYATNNL